MATRPTPIVSLERFELRGLYERQVGGLRALQNLSDADADQEIYVSTVGPLAHQPPGFSLKGGIVAYCMGITLIG